MKRETYNKDTKLEIICKENHKIIIFFEESYYKEIIMDKEKFKSYLQEYINNYPELFPSNIQYSWSLNGFVPASKKQDIKIRRIKNKRNKDVWQIHPSFIMPYMTCKTEEASKYLFLLNWCPYWALSETFGRDEMFYYRLHNHFGRYNIVGTTVKNPDLIPKDLAADEKHSKISGQKVYEAITVGNDCFLGASVSPTASQIDLEKSYGQFKKEAQCIKPDYKPDTVNTDGWSATINSWQSLFIGIVVIQCFLHAVLKIRNVATKKTKELYNKVADKAWHVFNSENKTFFSQRIRRLKEFAESCEDSKIKVALLKLCKKKTWFLPAYDFDNSLRTSNMIDRLINRRDRRLQIGKWGHGSAVSSEKNLRSFCLIQNFIPYCPLVRTKNELNNSAFEKLNKKKYSENWTENLLIATSIQSIYIFQQNPL